MSTFSHHYQSYPGPQLFIDPVAFTFSQYDVPRSKTPTDSLINHTGLSPGPLTTTTTSSRNPSLAPDPLRDQHPDQLLWDSGSLSNSPTSVRTPDCDSFEVDMLDSESMRNFYHQTDNTMSTQSAHNAIPALDSSVFLNSHGTISDQAIQAALDATMASGSQLYQQQLNVQQHQHIPTLPSQINRPRPNRTYSPSRFEPWDGQGPSRSSVTPQSGHVLFDLVSDPMNYSDFLDGSNSWTTDYQEQQYLISPQEQPTMSPQDNNMFFHTPQNLVHRPHIQIPQTHVPAPSPIDLQMTRASPSPDEHNFVNYTASSTIFREYTTSSQLSPQSPIASPMVQYSGSPLQGTISPIPVSPVSSDDMYSSYPPSNPDTMNDLFRTSHFIQTDPPSASPLKRDFLSIEDVSDMVRNMPYEANSSPLPMESKSSIKPIGGRAPGTHLSQHTARDAHKMRKIVACWHCVLQRDKCGPGDVCERCLKRSQRPNADCGLGCSRIKLVDLSVYFLPSLVTQMHEDSNLTHFVTQYIHQWGNTELTVWMTCGQNHMPRIPVKVYEFVPRGDALLVQIQYKINPATHERIPIKKQSPALGMVHINHNEEKKYDKYINDIVDNHLDAFSELCWMEDDNDFQQKLFRLMTRIKPHSDEEGKLLREVFRLVVVTFIMSHTLTIAEETKVATLSRMHSYGGLNSYVDNYTSPRMTNRQLKHFFSRLQRTIQTALLNKLQQIFKSSSGCDKWLAAFIAVLGMCMALEDQQKTIHLVMATKSATEGIDTRDAQSQADIACREIDTRMHFIQQIFRWKYNRKCNPLRDADHDWDKETGFGDASSVNFIRQAAQLVKENSDFLQQRQQVSISPANQTKYTSRLVGQFLLSFWLPNA